MSKSKVHLRVILASAALIVLIAAYAAVPKRAHVNAPTSLPSMEWAKQFEASLDLKTALPNESDVEAASEYARYYWLSDDDAKPTIIASYQKARPQNILESMGLVSLEKSKTAQGIYLGAPAYEWFDGGCSIITLKIDHRTQTILSAQCNGFA
ncbi:hypothetical protein [Brevundimonas pishanensis]|uniref:hypothetical protein n=1 Tax=Brevundimonas pishanensis TaxID=2896315 RepID=UPI001FA7AFB2|nr:hypothetical protein [Brevundimonas pishanensis]